MHDFYIVRFLRLVQNNLHDFGLQVFGSFLFAITAFRQPIEQDVGLGAQHQNKVEPSFGEEFARVVVGDDAHALVGTFLKNSFHQIKELVLVEYVRVEGVVVAFVALVLRNELPDVDMSQTHGFRDK